MKSTTIIDIKTSFISAIKSNLSTNDDVLKSIIEKYNVEVPVPDLIDIELLKTEAFSVIDLILKLINLGAKPEMFAEKNNLSKLASIDKNEAPKVDNYFKLLAQRLLEVASIDQVPPGIFLNLKPYKKQILDQILLFDSDNSFAALQHISENPNSVLGKIFREGHTDRSRGTFGLACDKYQARVNAPAFAAINSIILMVQQAYKKHAEFDWSKAVALIKKFRIHPSRIIYHQSYETYETVSSGGRTGMMGSRQTYSTRRVIRYHKIDLRDIFSVCKTKPTLEQVREIYNHGFYVIKLETAIHENLYDYMLLALTLGQRSNTDDETVLDKLTGNIKNAANNELLSYLPRIMHYEVCFSRSAEIGFAVIAEWLFKTAKPEQMTPEMLLNLKPHKAALLHAIKNMSIDDTFEALRQIKLDPNSVLGKVFREGDTKPSRGRFGKACDEYDKRANPPTPSLGSSIFSFLGSLLSSPSIPNANFGDGEEKERSITASL